jgi:uncharacterized Zn finger protein
MATDFPLSEPQIRAHSTAESFIRGQEYFRDGTVSGAVKRGQLLEAGVHGGGAQPYQVRVTIDAAGAVRTSCTCPYDFEGWCKHVVAVLLTCLHTPGALEQREPIAASLAPLDAAQLRDLLLDVSERVPGTASLIEPRLIAKDRSLSWPHGSRRRPPARATRS